jgi:glycogen debranching enzyme
MQRLKRKDWDTDRILSRSHFSLQDLTFNCILIRANQHLRDIAKCIGRPVPDDLDERMNKSEDALEKLWDGFYKQYYSRAFISHKLVKEPSIATLMPLYAGSITKERAVELVKILKSPNQFGTKFPLPSVPVSSNWYKELGYWQGPMWVNTNWLIADGLDRYGFSEEARHIREQSIAAVSRHGPYEYFSARTGEPAGAKNFSWTAALIIHMIKQTKSKEL